MHLPDNLLTGTLVRRYQRFLADVILDSGETITAHCPNSGSMRGCAVPGSRVVLSRSDRPGRKYPCTWELVEVKNVTLAEDGMTLFPDAVTERGQKHLHELMEVVRQGERGVIFFVVQRGDCRGVAPADRIDPRYGELLREAVAAGVEALAYRAEVSPAGVSLTTRLPVE